MAHSAKFLALHDGSRAWLYVWQPKGRPKAVVQIIHGMAEHAGRYGRFARELNAAGYAVVAQDLPGHGRTAAGPEQLGVVASEDPFRSMLSAINHVRAHIEGHHPGLPLILFGHSMGSFLAQRHVVEHGDGLAGCVLSATTGSLGPMRHLGVVINRAHKSLFGPEHKSAVTAAMTFGAFNKKFAPNRTESDWLSRDPAEVDTYIADPYCGFRCSANLWLSLLQATARLTDGSALRRIPKALPLLLISGDKDPVCEGEKGTGLLAAAYRRAGLKAELKIYPQARHELLNETNREQVSADLLSWMNAQLG